MSVSVLTALVPRQTSRSGPRSGDHTLCSNDLKHKQKTPSLETDKTVQRGTVLYGQLFKLSKCNKVSEIHLFTSISLCF